MSCFRPPTSPRRIVVIDDEAPARAWRRMGSNLGIELIFVERAQHALRTVLQERPDGIILDLRLPDGDGRDVLATLKRSPETAGIPVMVVSGAIRAFEARTCLELGAVGVEEKPAALAWLAERTLRGLPAAGTC